MSAPNGNGRGNRISAVAAARPMVLVRYRPGLTGETARAVHLVPLPVDGETGAASALCGVLLRPEEIERVNPGQGMPCSLCTLHHVAASPPPPPDSAPAGAEEISAEAGPLAAAVSYQVHIHPAIHS